MLEFPVFFPDGTEFPYHSCAGTPSLSASRGPAAPLMIQCSISGRGGPAHPRVTHVNGSGRLQTVSAGANPRYHQLIAAFRDLTGVPMVLNTSFNETEPVVCTPQEALDCFLRTNMDVLVLGNVMFSRQEVRRAEFAARMATHS